jgi:hypothetical protein
MRGSLFQRNQTAEIKMKMILKGGGLSRGYGLSKKSPTDPRQSFGQMVNDIDYKNIICIAERE